MIYAIRAVGTKFIKFGRAASVGRRLKELDTGCPHELHIEAVADWPDGQESAIHAYLEADFEKLEWFRDGDRAAQVIAWMQAGESGLRDFRVAFLAFAQKGAWCRMPRKLAQEYIYPSRSKQRVNPGVQPQIPRVSQMPELVTAEDRAKVNERFKRIKQRTIARQASKRSKEAAQEPAG